MRIIALLVVLIVPALARADRPNILLVITDDQGFGDFGAHGNPILKTPNLDAFAKESVWLKNFTVCPVCSPTRSSLLTGRYNYRTGVVDTFIGRSLLRPDVPTLPESLAKAGYRTGLFGKWHLGDNYPLRPEDRGFQETLWSRGGGIAQPSDHPDSVYRTAYFDPHLVRNGQEIVAKGYCTDAFTDGAVEFLRKDAKGPFFAYVAFNAPHGPYQVPEEAALPYRKRSLGVEAFPKLGQPWAGPKVNEREIADAYGMIANIDMNFGRLLKALDDRKVAENTIVIFMTDNGPGGVRYNAGLRSRKGSVYEGGIRVPCYVRWPKAYRAGHFVEVPTAHIDLTPTLLAAAGTKPVGPVDGRDAGPLLKNESATWPGRTIFTQWHRGDVPEKFRAFAARGPRYKLVQSAGVAPNAKWKPKYELFDLVNDPYERNDLAVKLPDEVERLKREYERWFDDVTKLGFDPARIHVGSDKEPITRLSWQDWRGPKAGWSPESIGHWAIFVERAGTYEVTIRSRTPFADVNVTAGDVRGAIVEKAEAKSKSLRLDLPRGNVMIESTVSRDGKVRGPDYVILKSVGNN